MKIQVEHEIPDSLNCDACTGLIVVRGNEYCRIFGVELDGNEPCAECLKAREGAREGD